MSLIKIEENGQLTLPPALLSRLGLATGALVEARVHAASIVLTPQAAIDPSACPTADDEYTPRQRRVVDARLIESAADVKEKRTFGPFDTAQEAIASMKVHLRQEAATKKVKRVR
jgi:ABC-type taurine transport system substrate-binding protein